MAAQSSILPVSSALLRSSHELRSLKDRLEGLEHHMEEVLTSKNREIRSEVVSSMQEVDLIVQSVQALADFLQEVSNQAELKSVDVCTGSAVQTVRLRDMANRLSGRTETSTHDGSPELF